MMMKEMMEAMMLVRLIHPRTELAEMVQVPVCAPDLRPMKVAHRPIRLFLAFHQTHTLMQDQDTPTSRKIQLLISLL